MADRAEKSRRDRREPHPLAVLAGVLAAFLLLAACYVGYQALHILFPQNVYETALPATVSDNVEADGVLLFDEVYVSGSGTLGYLAADGERVSAGTAVAEIYSDASQAVLRQQLTQLTEQIDLLAPDAVLINYARETIIDEDAVDAALREGKLSWFSCDFATPKTVKMPNTFITTHSGAGTGEAEANCADMAISELKDYLENGNIRNSVNMAAVSQERSGVCRLCLIHKNVPAMLASITTLLSRDGMAL